MAWIELHQAVWTHRKTLALAAELDLDETYAAAHVIRLWTWALDNAPEGDCSSLKDRVIAFGAGWKGDAGEFVHGLIASGWLDQDGDGLRLHDWEEYAGRLIQKRAANAERMREARAARDLPSKEERATHVQRTFPARAGATVPNRTVPNQTKPEITPNGVMVPAGTPRSGEKEQAIFEHYRARIQPNAKLDAREQIRARLRRFTPEELCLGIEHFAANTWQMDHNRTRGAPWFFHSDARSEQFLNLTAEVEERNGAHRERIHETGARGGGVGAPPGPERASPFAKYR